MKVTVIMRAIPAVCLILMATHGWAELDDYTDITLRLLEDNEGEEQVVRELSLPAEASEQGRISSAFGLATANAARLRNEQEVEANDEDLDAGVEGEEPERELIALPEDASEQARESAAYGLATANEAREQGRTFGQERANEAREAAAERREEARLTAAQELAAARERAAERQDEGRGQGHPEDVPGRPEDVPGRPEDVPGRPEDVPGRPEDVPGRPLDR